MKSVIDSLKGLVFETVPDKAPAPTASLVTPATTPAAPAPVPVHAGGATAPDPAALAKLEARLQSALPPAYAAFMEQYDLLKEDIPNEATRFKVALKTSHTTAEQIVAALDQLLGSMETARADFVHAFDENKEKRLGEAQKSIKATEDLIASHEAQLKSIQETIASLRTKRATDMEAMATEARRIEDVRAGFDAAHSQVVNRLASHKSHILAMPRA